MLSRSCAVALLFLLGCGSPPEAPKAVVRGKLLDNGKPFTPEGVRMKLPKGASLPPGSMSYLQAPPSQQYRAA